MKTYKWYSPQLKKKYNLYSLVSFSCMIVALFLTWLSSAKETFLILICLGGGVAFMLMSWRVQSGDKKLKR